MSTLLLGLLGGLFGFGALEVRSFEESSARDVAARLGGTPVVRVRARVGLSALWGDVGSVRIEGSRFAADALPLYTDPERPKSGKLGRLELHLTDFELRGLKVASLDAKIPNSRFDFGLALSKRRIRLSRSGTGDGTVVVREQDLADFVTKKYPGLSQVVVRIGQGRVDVSGHAQFVIINTDFHISAEIGIGGSAQFVLQNAVVEFNGKAADSVASQGLVRALNPVLDLDKDLGLLGAVRLRSVRLGGGAMTATGDLHIPDRPKVPSGKAGL